MFSSQDLDALALTVQLAGATTVILLLIGTPLGWWLARTRLKVKPFLEAIVALPLVLPPTVLGFYLLLMLGSDGPIGGLAVKLGGAPLAFTFTGLLIGSVVYSLPFVVQPLQNSFASIDQTTLDVAATLRAGPIDRFATIVIPMARRGLLSAAVLGFAHTVGEFGVVLMIGGNIPGVTRVASIAVYDHVESLDYSSGHALSLVLLVASFVMLASIYVVNRRLRFLPG